MLSPPQDLPEDVLVPALARAWGVTAAAMAYRPVGFGSHHWQVTDAEGVPGSSPRTSWRPSGTRGTSR